MRYIHIIYYTKRLKDIIQQEASLSIKHDNDINTNTFFLIIELLAWNIKIY